MARNAFAIRTSETSSSDEVFARYFAPEVLTVLPENLFATSALVLRSSPGGGKTSLMRIFAPGPLLQVIRNQQHPPHEEIHQNLSVLGAVDESGARAFGVYVPCASGYTEIGPPLEDSAARSLFRALINIRVLLRTLRALCVLHDLDYPSGLEQISCSFNPAPFFDEGPIPRDRDLSALRAWAEEVESRCFATMDGFSQPRLDLPLHTSFDAIFWLSQTSFELHGQSISARPIVMFDDVHRLRPSQRDMLYRELLDHRSGTPVWLAERTFVLDPSELLTEAMPRRDYIEIRLEHVWQKAKPRQYVRFVRSIADRRMVQMRTELESFGDHLAANLSDHTTQSRVAEALEKVKAKVRAAAAGTTLFDDWLRAAEKHRGDPLEKAIEWTKVGILIARERANRQPSLELPLPEDELEARGASGLAQAAERFMCTDLGLPYFYGIERVVRLSSYNVEEFLQICAVLYEHIHADRITRRRGGGPVSVSAKSQHDALKKLAERRFQELPRLFPLGPQAQRLILAIGQMCRERTYEPNAPYAPGVTGIGLNSPDRITLLKSARDGPGSAYYEIASVVSSCVAQNLFEVRENLRQDNKEWVVLYLNRIFCAHYDLCTILEVGSAFP